MTKTLKPRTAGIFWLVASGLSLAAAGITYSGGGEIRWSLVAAAVFLAAMGLTTLRRSKSDSA